MSIRAATADEIGPLAQLWYDAWQDAHAGLLPPALARLRTLESFAERLRARLADLYTAGPAEAPRGFYVLKGDELYQLFVAAEARGTGLAIRLTGDAETRLARQGVRTAWLSCAIGNDRAARFYEKCGWRRTGTIIEPVETSEGEFPLEVWRYEKRLAGTP